MQIGPTSLPDRVPDPTSTDPGAQTSGPSFDRLIAAAQAEADRRKSIAAQSGASADQFSEQGWLAIVKAHGGEIGLGAAANAITKDSHGQFTVVDSALRAKVINYRNDPLVRSIMAVKRAGDGRATLTAELGRQPTDAELRVADTIGAKAAAKLITTRQSTPNASAAIVSPDAAKANRAAFYRPDGSPQTVNEVLVALMKPTDAAASPDVERLLAGHASFAGPAQASTQPAQAIPTTGMTPEMAANLRARAAFASASVPTPALPKQRVAPPRPPDLALVGGTIGNLSMPGSATGQTAPTGGKVSGWRAQMVGEVTHQIEHPESTVTNLPSKVTIPAPVVGRHGAPNPVASSVLPAPASQQLGPQLVPSAVLPQPMPPVALATPAAASQKAPIAGVQPVAASAALPSLVAAQPGEAVSALPLLPIGEMQMPMVLGPRAPAPPVATAPMADGPAEVPTAASVIVRSSRYGPSAGASLQVAGPRALDYVAATPEMAASHQSDASSAGIRPSRYFASAAVAAQQFASLNRPQASAQPLIQSVAPTMLPAASMPAIGQPSVGPSGTPMLPPVPGPSGLPPITASEALQPGGQQETALLEGNKPLDLAPSRPAAAPAPVAAAQPVHPKQHPRLTPGNF